MVMFFSFNEVSSDGDLYSNFNFYVNDIISNFAEKYNVKNVAIDPNNAANSLSSLFRCVKQEDGEIYIIVDEIDSFMSYMLVSIDTGTEVIGKQNYEKLISKGSNVIRSWGNVVKTGTNNVVKRLFITGVAPIALADGMSSLNSVADITFRPQFAGMFGFAQSDVERALQDCFEMKGWMMDERNYNEYSKHLNIMKTYYNGYHFMDTQEESMYNPQSCLYYLQELFATHQSPNVMMDKNLSEGGKNVVRFLLSHRNLLQPYSILSLLHGQVVQSLYPHFSSAMLFDVEEAQEALVSLAFFQGYLTFKVTRDEKNIIIPSSVLWAPNKAHYDDFLSKVPKEMKVEMLNSLQQKTTEVISFTWKQREILQQLFLML